MHLLFRDKLIDIDVKFDIINKKREDNIMEECFFCKSIKNKDFELENEYAIARFDDFPVNNGHLEIIPKRHVKDWWNI